MAKAKQLKWSTLDAFNEGLRAYAHGDFTRAGYCFDNLLKINPADSVARYFSMRAGQHSLAGMELEWSGVEVMLEK